MSKKSFVDSVEVKSPCSESWNNMQGTDKIRFCSHCSKSVNNLSEMTRKQATRLVRASNGNLCIRYIPDPNTKRPMFAEQLLQITRRAPSVAAGVMSASIALSSHAYAQEATPVLTTSGAVERSETPMKKATQPAIAKSGRISGTVADQNGAVIPNVPVRISNNETNDKRSSVTDQLGSYSFDSLAPGRYEVTHDGVSGFASLTIKEVGVEATGETKLTPTLAARASEIVGDIAFIQEYVLPLSQAIQSDEIDSVRDLLVRGAKVNEREKEGKLTPLFLAVENGNLEIVQVLLDNGAKVNVRDAQKQTPLMRLDDDAAPELVDLLVRYGAKVNLADKEGNTVLILASGSVNAEVLKALIDAGADVRAKNKLGRTALMEAAENDDLESVKLLLEAGAEVNARDKEGDSAWDLTSNDEIEQLLETYGAETKGDDEDEAVIPIVLPSR